MRYRLLVIDGVAIAGVGKLDVEIKRNQTRAVQVVYSLLAILITELGGH